LEHSSATGYCPQLGIHLGTGIVPLIINAFIGAVVLLLILRQRLARRVAAAVVVNRAP
jgi:uncharacterized membrane protein YeaQ/YmgE (transglycosylase-associated protein family)